MPGNDVSGETDSEQFVAISPGSPESAEAARNQERARECEEIIEQHRSGTVSYAIAIGRISFVLSRGGVSAGNIDSVLGPYVEMLNEVGKDRDRAAERGVGVAEGLQPVLPIVEQHERGSGLELGGRERGSRDRDDGGDIPGSDPTFAWLWTTTGREPVWDADQSVNERAHHLQGAYEQDPKLAYRSVMRCYRRPAFPPALWRDVLCGRFVDLDRVREDILSLAPSHTEKVVVGAGGELEVANIGSTSSKKFVVDLPSWTEAWDRYQGAVVFAFPMRTVELSEYKEWITEQFRAVSISSRVIALDRAIRKSVQDNPRFSLNDIGRWGRHTTQFLSSYGIGEVESAVSEKRRGRSLRTVGGGRGDHGEICRNWNRGTCRFDDCKYAHVCSRCKGSHPERDHPKTGGVGGSR